MASREGWLVAVARWRWRWGWRDGDGSGETMRVPGRLKKPWPSMHAQRHAAALFMQNWLTDGSRWGLCCKFGSEAEDKEVGTKRVRSRESQSSRPRFTLSSQFPRRSPNNDNCTHFTFPLCERACVPDCLCCAAAFNGVQRGTAKSRARFALPGRTLHKQLTTRRDEYFFFSSLVTHTQKEKLDFISLLNGDQMNFTRAKEHIGHFSQDWTYMQLGVEACHNHVLSL